MDQTRDTIGETAELYVDANGAYSSKQAIRLMADAAATWTCTGSKSPSPPMTSMGCAPSPTR
jgi:hypothetical protein